MASLLSRAGRNAKAIVRGAEWGSGSAIPPNSANSMIGGSGLGLEAGALGISTVLACTKALHDDFKAMPFGAFSGKRDGARKRIPSQPRIVAEPFGPDVEPGVGFGQMVASLAMRGNAYALVVNRDPDTGLPDQLAVVHPDLIHAIRNSEGRKVFKISGRPDLAVDEVVHITGLMMPGAVEGVDIITAQRINLALAGKVTEYAEGFFGNGGSPAGVISVPNATGGRQEARDVLDAWTAGHGGVANAHRPAVMFGGATWTQMSVTPDNAQFLETRKFLREEICGLFGVPLQRVQAITEHASQGGGAGVAALDRGYVQHGLLPVARAFEMVWDRLIDGGSRTWTSFGFDEWLRADPKTRAGIAQIHRVGAIRTVDEIRAEEGWEPYPDGTGSDPFVPLNSNTSSPTGGEDNAPPPDGGQS